MKITNKQLKQIIKEELSKIMKEDEGVASQLTGQEIYFTTDDKYWKIEISSKSYRGMKFYWAIYVLSPGKKLAINPEVDNYTIIDDSSTHKGYRNLRSVADCIDHMAHILENDPNVNYDTLSYEAPTDGLKKLVEELQHKARSGQSFY